MKYLKIISIFLVILLALFIIQGIMFGAMMFFIVLKLIAIAAIVAGIVYLYFKNKKQ